MRQLLLLAALGGAAAAACANSAVATSGQPVGPAVERAALSSPHASRAVLLGSALVGQRLVAVGERGLVIWSDDAGVQWHQAKVPVSVTLTAVRFVNQRLGWATGHGGTVLMTRDGGETWTRQLDGHMAAQALLAQAKLSGDARRVRDTERMVADGADKPFLDLHFFDERRGMVVGAYNLAFTTQDGGKTWQPLSDALDNPQGMHLYAVRARGNTVVIAGEQGLVLLSDDGGQHFRKLTTPYRGSFFTSEIMADGSIWLAGLRGNVWHSRDAGASWSALPGAGTPPLSASVTTSVQAANGTLLLGTQAGQTLVVRGDQLQLVPGQPSAPVTNLLPLPNGRLLTLTLRGLNVATATPADAKKP